MSSGIRWIRGHRTPHRAYRNGKLVGGLREPEKGEPRVWHWRWPDIGTTVPLHAKLKESKRMAEAMILLED